MVARSATTLPHFVQTDILLLSGEGLEPRREMVEYIQQLKIVVFIDLPLRFGVKLQDKETRKANHKA